ncbi:MAG: HEAT repeat domain-containing protein, partial [Nitrospirota bacterium]|nr:HEAT repeat domain-containing protein [Nitrospirota bacterium]
HAFFTFCISLINNNTHYAGQKSEGICYAPLLAVDNIAATGPKRADLTSSAPEALRRTLQNSDFIFDFVVDETAVLHDLEFAAESASLFDNSQLCQLQKAFVADELCSRLGADNIASVSIAIFSEEGSDNMLSDSSFDIMIELIESDALESDLFLKMLGKLTSLADELIEKGEFDKILELYNSLRTQSLQGKNSMYAVSMIRSVFSTDSFNCNAVEALKQYGRKRRESAGKFMLALRSFLVPFLLDALNEENDPSKRRFMITLLTSVRGDVLPFIINRLHDARWYVVRNMLYLLRECNGRSYVKEVKNFLGHKVALVQIEALRTFLSFQDTEADFYVRKFLKSRVLELQKGAVRLAGAYRIKNAVPYMIRLLNEKDMLGQKFLFKKRIIRMLGRIGDGRAVGQLLQICRSTSVVHNNDLQRLKIEIFKTVHFYPLATIGPLLNYGMKSSSKEIVTISNKLIERYKVPYNRGDS